MRRIAAIVLAAGILVPGSRAGFPVTASSVHSSDYAAAFALDGRGDSRWASADFHAPAEWLAVDLGTNRAIRKVTLRWEAAYPVAYEFQVSDNGADWRTVARRADGRGGVESFDNLACTGRHVRVYCTKPGPHGLVSLWELEFDDPAVAEAVRAAGGTTLTAEAPAILAAAGVREIVFAARENGHDGHWYANFGYYAQDENRKCYGRFGKLGVLDVATRSVRMLVDDPEGGVRDPCVHYDAKKVVFSWRRGGSDPYHLYEINLDGTGLRQLTEGIYDDLEPCYLPDGGIVFVSSRCRRWVNCWLTQVATLHRCDADGGNVRELSANVEQDNTPWVLPDGRILYMRWEYVDRSQVHYHHLWSMYPDGTRQQVFFGNLNPGGVFIDAKPIPGTRDVLFINSPGHGAREHAGHIATVSERRGPDELSELRNISDPGYRDPFPLSADALLAANGRRMVLRDTGGREATLFALPPDYGPAELHEPRPVLAHPRERVIAARAKTEAATGEFVLSDLYDGRNMAGVARGEIRRLLVLESLPKPVNYTGGMDPLSYGGTFTLERIVGTVPVEADGSARFELPANRAFFFVALDASGRAVKRMQSFTTAMAGETVGCVGCHEPRTRAPGNYEGRNRPLAMTRAASIPEPVPGVPEVVDFPRDVQPVLDALCVKCHGYDRTEAGGPRSGRLILAGDRGPMFSHSYYMMTVARLFADGRNDPKSNYAPRALGSGSSRILALIDGSHHGVKATPEQERMLRMWIDSGAAYPGTYAALGSGMIGAYASNTPVDTDAGWATTDAGAEVIRRRCVDCHKDPKRVLPQSLSDERGLSFWRPDWNDPRLNTSRHIVFNLSRPEKSILLLAPLAASAGGWGLCKDPATKQPVAVFAGTDDPDYAKLLAMCAAGRDELAKRKRFDMPGFRPPQPYIREMQRYGVLPKDLAPGAPVDPYATDRAYWSALWYRPAGGAD